MSPEKLTKSKLRLFKVPRLTSKFESIKIQGDRDRLCQSPYPKEQDEPHITILEEKCRFQGTYDTHSEGSQDIDATSFLSPLPEI